MKVLVKLRVHAGDINSQVVQAKNIMLERSSLGTHILADVIGDAIQKARWIESGLRTRSIRFYDKDFEEYVDVEEDERPVGLGKYEVVLEKTPRIAVATASHGLPIAATSAGRLASEDHQNGQTSVEFYVKSLSGRMFTFNILKREDYHRNLLVTDTVETLKAKIEHLFGLPPSQQRLVSAQGREMRNEQTLDEFPQLGGSKIEVSL
ncbi:hypothetical protein AAVH_23590 [Aphelenchoides avenae]|nr:hypothetical protein AAVH_23590 [Aphelenchus avenae]